MIGTVLLEDGWGGVTALHVRPRDRIAARLQAHRIDADLARGVSPDTTAARALRAHTLTSIRNRRVLARGLAHAVAAGIGESTGPALLNRRGVREASRDIEELRRLLLAAGPVPVHGVAGAQVLLTDGAEALYGRAEPGAVTASVRGLINRLRADGGAAPG